MLRFLLGLVFPGQAKTQEWTSGPVCFHYFTGPGPT